MSFANISKQAVPNDSRSGRQAGSQTGPQASPLRWRPHVLTRLLRRRSVYWTLAVGLILLTVGVTYSQNRQASSIISSLGEQHDVLVAVRDLERGEAISREDFRIEQRPTGFVPLGALKWSGDLTTAGGSGGLEGASSVAVAAGSEVSDASEEWNGEMDWGAEWNAESRQEQVALEPIYAGEILPSAGSASSPIVA